VTPPRFDELIHAPTRLAIVSLLAAVERADFSYIRDDLGLSDSALSKQLTTLEQAGYVEIRKGFVGKRPRTSVRLSKAGRQAFHGHVAALQEMVAPAGAGVLRAAAGQPPPGRAAAGQPPPGRAAAGQAMQGRRR
jgi:DNA-binding MarR family transcriptional regulator